jgi:formamidopyrimidine-DNA glycosylase
MPELPEVETVTRYLQPRLEGRIIASAPVFVPKLVSPLNEAQWSDKITGRKIGRVWRRGKYLVWDLDNESLLVGHLRMTGGFLYADDTDKPDRKSIGGGLTFTDGTSVWFFDPRKFSTWNLLDKSQEDEYFAKRLGPEPLTGEFSRDYLLAALKNRKSSIKGLLLNQKIACGVGNIYADEALWHAKIHPLTKGNTLTPAEAAELVVAVKRVLKQGIDAKGASVSDYYQADGQKGTMQNYLHAYAQTGKSCARTCGGKIEKISVNGRGTHFCPVCQIADHHKPQFHENPLNKQRTTKK